MKTRSASKRETSRGSPNSLGRPQIKSKSTRLKRNRVSDTLDSSDDSSDEDVSFQKRGKNVQRRLTSDSSDASDYADRNGNFREKTKRQRLSSDSSASSQCLETSDMENRTKRRRQSSESSKGTGSSEEESSSSSTSNERKDPKRITRASKRRRLCRNTSDSSAESDTNSNSPRSSDESDVSQKRTKRSKRIRFLKNKENSSDDSEEIDVGGLLKHKFKKLRFAVSYNNTDQVANIIADRYVKLKSREFGNLLWRALENKNMRIISMLVRAGVDVNVRGSGDDRDKTLLHVIAGKPTSEELDELALLLIENGADVEELDGNGNTVLHCAIEGGSPTIVEKLLELDADVAAVNLQEESILYAASKSPTAEKFLPLLVQYNVPDEETKDSRAMEVLGYLIRGNGNMAAIKVLLDLDVPINEQDERGLTLLDYAISRQKSFEIVKLLLEYGADPTKRRNDGVYPLWWASTLKTCSIAALLIKYGANIHARNDNGQYPLHAACNYSSVQCIGLLLFLGAKVNDVDDRGLTPFFIMNTTYLSDANKIMIKHFAVLASKNIRINDRDMFELFSRPFIQEFYEKCLDELKNMRTLKIYNDISAYCILAQGVKKLTQFIRNNDFVKNYYQNQMSISGAFPMYSSSIQKFFSTALKIRKSMICEIEALDEATNFILPEEIWEIIAFHSCCNRMVDFYV